MATLTVTITESLPDYNGADNDLTLTNALSISGVDDVYHRIITCPAADGAISGTTLVKFSAAVNTTDGVAALDLDNVKYMRVTNLDGSNSVTLSLKISNDEDGAQDHSSSILLEAGKSFLMGTPHDGIAVHDSSTAVLNTLVDLESIVVDPIGNDVKVEVFIASVV
tara:strand:+ start:41 stop:538 length:498 start_codon:yes stop_codon:yes gene_type:complete